MSDSFTGLTAKYQYEVQLHSTSVGSLVGSLGRDRECTTETAKED